MTKYLPIVASLMLMTTLSGAQPPQQGMRPAPPKMKSPTEIATEKAKRMQSELSLDKKQYKKVYKLFKKDCEYRQKALQDNMPGGMPPQGGPGMGGGMGGPGDFMGGGMPGGGMMGGGMPGGGMMGGGPGMGGGMMDGGQMPPQGGMQPGQGPEGGPGMGPGGDVVSEEYLEKQEKKLKKILTAEQYEKWRSKHPAEHLELPPMELK